MSTDLSTLLTSLRPVRQSGEFVFVTTPTSLDIPVRASVQEAEGTSSIIPRAEADRLGLVYDFVAAWITLEVHSALTAVGLTAAVSHCLTEVGISCNVVAGHHHDHLLVPLERADAALAALATLQSAGPSSLPAHTAADSHVHGASHIVGGNVYAELIPEVV